MIEAIETDLALPPDALELTWRSLAEVGNLSSSSVLHVLRDTLDKRTPDAGHAGRAHGDGAGILRRARAARVVSSVIWYPLLIAAVALERVAELVISRRNLDWSLRQGGREYGRRALPGHGRAAHRAAGRLRGRGESAPTVHRRRSAGRCSRWSWPRRGCAGGAFRRSARGGTPASSSSSAWPRRRSGPYRWLRHPNYVAVVVEGAALPLVHTAWITAVVFTVLNAALLAGAHPGREPRARPSRPRRPDACTSTCSSPAPARPASPPRSTRSRAGLEVAVLDPRPSPIDKACGEGLMPGAVRELERARRELRGQPFRGIRYTDGRTQRRGALSVRGPGWACAAPTCRPR